MTQRARKSRSRRSRGSLGRKFLIGFGVVVFILLVGVASVGAWVLNVWNDAPTIDSLKAIDQGETSSVYAADGSLLGYIEDDVIREPVDLDEIPMSLRHATIAIEDQSFRDHEGVDPEAIVRAALENIEAGDIRQGGSTITQQLVRNLYIAHPEDTIERKLEEAKLATELEDERSKNWILEQYLNTASYGTNAGRTAVGVEAASQVYFDKHVSELNLWEAALLAGLPQAPSEYNPFLSEAAATQRRNQVLRKMFQQGYITRKERDHALKQGLGRERGYKYETVREPYFYNYVEQELIERYGVNTVRSGGLKVYTTINPGLQAAATTAVRNGVAPLGGPAGALVATEVDTGHILAMASSASFETSQYNLAAQGHRQPGSSFKPFALATAIKQGIDPDSTYYSGASPVTLQLPYETWTVNNSSEASAGTLSLTAATTNSTNAVYAQLGLDVGPENVAATAHSLGIESPLDGLPAETIGGLRVGVSPLDMSNAYATFANGGVHHNATAVSRVAFPNGEVDEPDDSDGTRALTDGEAYEVTRILKTVVDSGTGTAADYGCSDLAGKTGTTDDNTDAWFVGYTPNISTAVWIGYPNDRTSLGSSAFGGTYSAPIWNEFMSQADPSCDSFTQPAEMPDLSPYHSEHTATSPADDYDSGYDSGYTQPTTPAPAPAPADPDAGTDTGGAYNEEQFQAGASPAGGGGD